MLTFSVRRPHLGDVRDPPRVGSGRPELPCEYVWQSLRCLAAVGAASHPLPDALRDQALLGHDPVAHLLRGDRAGRPRAQPDPAAPVPAAAADEASCDVAARLGVACRDGASPAPAWQQALRKRPAPSGTAPGPNAPRSASAARTRSPVARSPALARGSTFRTSNISFTTALSGPSSPRRRLSSSGSSGISRRGRRVGPRADLFFGISPRSPSAMRIPSRLQTGPADLAPRSAAGLGSSLLVTRRAASSFKSTG